MSDCGGDDHVIGIDEGAAGTSTGLDENEYAAGDELITFPCAHVYHAKCGTEWLRHKPNCPTCQFDVAEALKRF